MATWSGVKLCLCNSLVIVVGSSWLPSSISKCTLSNSRVPRVVIGWVIMDSAIMLRSG